MLKVTQKQSFTLSSVIVFFEIYSQDKAWVFLMKLQYQFFSNYQSFILFK